MPVLDIQKVCLTFEVIDFNQSSFFSLVKLAQDAVLYLALPVTMVDALQSLLSGYVLKEHHNTLIPVFVILHAHSAWLTFDIWLL